MRIDGGGGPADWEVYELVWLSVACSTGVGVKPEAGTTVPVGLKVVS